MHLGGLASRVALKKLQKPTRKCERCGLHYASQENDTCPHCGSLSESELKAFLAQIANERASSRRLGFWFFFIAIILLWLVWSVSNT